MRNRSIPCMPVLKDAYHIEWEAVGGIWSSEEVDAFVREGKRGVCTEENRSDSFGNVRWGFRFSMAWLEIRSYF